MKKRRNALLLLLLFLFSMVHSEDKHPITIVMSGSYPPWNDTKDREYVGFEPDMIKEMCTRIKRTCKIKTIFWKELIKAVRFNKFDVGISGIEINSQTQKILIYSIPYARKGTVFVARKDSQLAKTFCKSTSEADFCSSPVDLDKLTSSQLSSMKALDKLLLQQENIGIERNTGRAWIITNFFKELKQSRMDTTSDVFKSLQEGAVQQILVNRETWDARASQPEFSDFTAVGPTFYGSHLGSDVAVIANKKHKDIIEAMNDAITSMQKDGTLSKLSKKWFGRDISNSQDTK